MLVTVTANTGIDQTFFIPQWQAGQAIRATQSIQSMAGKPTDAAFILGKLGMPSIALGFAAGTIGKRVESMLQERGVETRFIPVDGESRVNTIIIDETSKAQTTITATSLVVREHHLQTLRKQYTAALAKATCIIMGGSLPNAVPPAFYTDLIAEAQSRHIPVIFDAEKENLRAGLQSSPTYIKPNEHELAQFTGRKIETLEDAYAAGKAIQQQYGTSPIITLGQQGALAILPDKTYFIPALPLEVVSAAGAGDGVLAGLAYSIVQGQPIEAGLKMGIALASAVCLQPGTAEFDVEDFNRLLPQVQLIAFPY
jgi:1-phosphofructokinase family hexose kinase